MEMFEMKQSIFGTLALVYLSYLPQVTAAISDCKNPYTLDLNDNVKIRFCEIPGTQESVIGLEKREKYTIPIRKIKLDTFFMGQFEVTQEQFQTVMGIKPWIKPNARFNRTSLEGPNYPASDINYRQAETMAKFLSILDKTATYRLPTSAEWEYAARAGSNTTYYWGNEYSPDFAYSSNNSSLSSEVFHCPNKERDQQTPGYCANKYGLMHMAGNVSEMVSDVYRAQYTKVSSNDPVTYPFDGHQAVTEINLERQPREYYWSRLIRGGSFEYPHKDCRSSSFYWQRDSFESVGTGFRLVRIPKNKSKLN